MSQSKLLLLPATTFVWVCYSATVYSSAAIVFKHHQQQNLRHGLNFQLFSPIVSPHECESHTTENTL